jgi:hypothetical protein
MLRPQYLLITHAFRALGKERLPVICRIVVATTYAVVATTQAQATARHPSTLLGGLTSERKEIGQANCSGDPDKSRDVL